MINSNSYIQFLPSNIVSIYMENNDKCIGAGVINNSVHVYFSDNTVKIINSAGENKFMSAWPRLTGDHIDFLLSDGTIHEIETIKFKRIAKNNV